MSIKMTDGKYVSMKWDNSHQSYTFNDKIYGVDFEYTECYRFGEFFAFRTHLTVYSRDCRFILNDVNNGDYMLFLIHAFLLCNIDYGVICRILNCGCYEYESQTEVPFL